MFSVMIRTLTSSDICNFSVRFSKRTLSRAEGSIASRCSGNLPTYLLAREGTEAKFTKKVSGNEIR